MNFIYKNLFALPNLRPYTKHKKQHAPGWTGWCSKSKSSLVPPGRLTVSQSVSGTLDRPRVVRSALQDLRSCAILQASSALRPVSSSICCIHVRQRRPRWRFHSGLMCMAPFFQTLFWVLGNTRTCQTRVSDLGSSNLGLKHEFR